MYYLIISIIIIPAPPSQNYPVCAPEHNFSSTPPSTPDLSDQLTGCLLLLAVLEDALDDATAVGVGRQAHHLAAERVDDELKQKGRVKTKMP